MALTELDETSFKRFRDIIYEESGIKLNESKRALMQSRLMKRLRELGMDGYRDYYGYLMDNYRDEIVNLINAITTNKTDFFRESKHFDYMTGELLPEFVKSGKNELKIWSAGCSTGEEPYSIAITAHRFFENRKAPEIRILATDIDTQVLNRGRAGIYKAEDILEVVDMTTAKRYFQKGTAENEGFLRVKDFIRRMVFFRRLNLLDASFPMKGKFDIIFCRNVIIYFDRESQKRLFANFHRHLADDGYLFVGHSETLTGITDRFVFIRNTIYKKVL
jgi:chemotaxis protein methyltransferase CheR